MAETEANVRIAKRWLAAFNSRQLDVLVGLYDEKCQHVSPKLKVAKPETCGIVEGVDALRRWFNDSFAKYQSLEYLEVGLTADLKGVWMEYLRRVPNEPDTMVAEYLEISPETGKILKSRVYHG
ncbi:hypothetical protein HDU83_007555 [Entophlyctis luteolus]|nr:hypothetical protein HDU83_007555 [Entophlyctis luteolus]